MSFSRPTLTQRATSSRKTPIVHTGAEPRLAALSVVRAAMVGVVVVAAFLDPVIDAAASTRMLVVAGAWAVLLVIAEGSRRLDIGVAVVARGAFLLDGVLLMAATVADGGSTSPMFFLAFVHVIAITLLASYLTGLKVAAWDSALLLVAAAAQTAGAIPFLTAGGGQDAAAAVIRAGALVAITVVTAGASALNERELRRSRSGLETMLATGESLMGVGGDEEVMQIAVATLCGPLGFTRAAMIVSCRGGSPMIAQQRRDQDAQTVEVDRDFVLEVPDDTLLRAEVASTDVPGLPDLLDGQSNVVAIPIEGQRVRGVLAASLGGAPRRRGLPVRTLGLIHSLATQVTQTMDRIALTAEIEEVAAQDGLTGVPNRRRFDEKFEEMLAAARARKSPLSVIVIDIDHFKQVNDEHGHQVGDEVLKAVAGALRAGIRSDDMLARYGGEEFAVLLPGTSISDAIHMAERLRAKVGSADSPVAVTVSLGVASSDVAGLDADPLFAAADRALYVAKEDGRNRVRVAAPAVDRIPTITIIRIPESVS